MARRLFEMQGIRRRNGQLASGVAFVVYGDAGGTALADISATSGGSSIAGSAVTTADIAGLGPAALLFYGPPSGQDTLWLRCPTDSGLGVQEIEADEDERLDALEAAAASGGIPGSIFDAKGDLIAASAADTAARLAVGANGQVLTAASGQPTGLQWATPAATAAASVTYVKTYVPAPDGTTDNTAGLNAAVAAAGTGGVLEFEQGKTYVQTDTIRVTGDGTFLRGNGAKLKAGSSKTSELDNFARQLDLVFVDDVTVDGLQFIAPASAFAAPDPAEVGTIRIAAGSNVKVRNCNFSGLGGNVYHGVWVRGTGTTDTLIEANHLDGCGITYSYDGASRTICRNNVIRNAVDNALNGVGNHATLYNEDCLVEGNLVIDAARMGVEDQVRTRGTIIRGNAIFSPASIGISAVGHQILVGGNTIVDPGFYGIEAISDGHRVIGNQVRYVSATPAIGIICNTATEGVVQGNYIEKASVAIDILATPTNLSVVGNIIDGKTTTSPGIRSTGGSGLTIADNTLRNLSSSAIAIFVQTAAKHLTIAGNVIDIASAVHGIYLYGGVRYWTITGNTIKGAGAGTLNGIALDGSYDGTVAANHVYNTLNGVQILDQTGGATLNNITIDGNGFATVTNPVVTGSLSGSTLGTGIQVRGNAGLATSFLDYTNKVLDTHGTGTPESVVTAGIGSTFHRTDGGVNTSLYIKQSGTGNTGWAAVTP